MTPVQACAPNPKMPLWAKLLGARCWHGDGTANTKIGEVSTRRATLALQLCCYSGPHLMIGLLLFTWFMPLPRWTMRIFARPDGLDSSFDRPRYGFSWSFGDGDGSTLHVAWGQRSAVIWMPWMLEHIRTEYLGTDLQWWDARAEPGSFELRHPNPRFRYEGPEGPAKWSETHPYRYMFDNGDVQEVNATITRRRAMHGRRWFGSGPISRMLRRWLPKHRFESIDVQFDQEMGERRGSWKGGCIGTSFNMKPEETPKIALRRMQRERRFR